MTAITYETDGTTFALKAVGHAGYARPGEPDIACAAVSVLMCTLIRRIKDLRAAGKVADMEVWRAGGDAGAMAVAADGAREAVRGAYEAIVTGCRLLAAKYPAHIVFAQKARGRGEMFEGALLQWAQGPPEGRAYTPERRQDTPERRQT